MTRARGDCGACGDRGSITLLVLGFTAVCLLALVVLVDASAAYLQRRELVARADAAALAGAQGIDLAAYYAHGATAATRLDPGTVARRVRTQVVRSGAADVAGLRLRTVSTDGERVHVVLSMPLRLPFLPDAFAAEVWAEADAVLAYRAAAAG